MSIDEIRKIGEFMRKVQDGEISQEQVKKMADGELSEDELEEVAGGFLLAVLIVGSIIGGSVYTAVKWGW